MKSIFISTFLLLFFFTSCNKKQDSIDIYLIKKRIETKDGVPINVGLKDSAESNALIERFGEKIRYDSINKEVIFAGHFSVNKNDLEEKPFIIDSEIIGANFEKSEIYFAQSACIKITKSIKNWKKENNSGKQFAICYNGEIILTGYFYNIMNSYLSNTYQIMYHPFDENDKDKVRYMICEGYNFKKNNLLKNKKLYNAFKNRLIK